MAVLGGWFNMNNSKRSAAYRVIVGFLAFDLIFLLAGQTLCLFDYDFTVRMGLQEDSKAIGEYGIQVNRAFGLGDTVVLIPLTALALIGLVLKKRWALTALAAAMGVTLYWPFVCIGLFSFLDGVAGYTLVPGFTYWVAFGLHMGFALWTLLYIAFRGQALLDGRKPASG
jgi:hypothetical protein